MTVLTLSLDQQLFEETTDRFLTVEMPRTAIRALRASIPGFDATYWRRGAELGWTSLLVSEDDGGGSISREELVDLTIVARQFGRHAAPGPLTATNVVAFALSRYGSAEQRAALLPGIVAGDTLVSWAWSGRGPKNGLGDCGVAASRTDGGWLLTGEALPIESGVQCRHLLVTAADGVGLTQFLVPCDTQGLSLQPLEGLDLTRRYAAARFKQVFVGPDAVVGLPSEGETAVEQQLQIALVIQCAETVGAMEAALEMTIEWSFDRYSFGRPLASYQEIKHRFADMKTWLEASHAIADAAARAVQTDSADAPKIVSAAASYVGHHGVELVQDCVQIHGGIGLTFEHDLHLYLRRATQNSVLYGAPSEHQLRVTFFLERAQVPTNPR